MYSIVFTVGKPPGEGKPPAHTPRVELEAPPIPSLFVVTSPKSVALPRLAIVIALIVFVALVKGPSVNPKKRPLVLLETIP